MFERQSGGVTIAKMQRMSPKQPVATLPKKNTSLDTAFWDRERRNSRRLSENRAGTEEALRGLCHGVRPQAPSQAPVPLGCVCGARQVVADSN